MSWREATRNRTPVLVKTRSIGLWASMLAFRWGSLCHLETTYLGYSACAAA